MGDSRVTGAQVGVRAPFDTGADLPVVDQPVHVPSTPSVERVAPQRADANPLDAAFAPPVMQRFDEESERALVAERGPTLVAYGRFDRRAPPIVLVHGINGSGAEMTALADRLTQAGRQVYMFQYQDNDARLATSGEHLARELRALWARTPRADVPLDIVAHSMGGIVTRLALNQLAEAGVPRTGFPRVRVHTLDTPYAGGTHEPGWTRFIGSEAGSFLALGVAGRIALHDMRGSSAMFAGLYATKLEGVTFANTAARLPSGEAGIALNAHDFSAEDRNAIAAYLMFGSEPDSPRARNYARSLAHDVRGDALRARVLAETRDKPLAEALLAAYDAVMPPVVTDHASIVSDPQSPAVERLLAELAAGAPVNAAPR